MSKETKQIRFTFSPKALISAVPAVSFRDLSRKIQEFLFSLGSLVYLHLVFVTGSYQSKKFTTLEKQENYINFRVLLTRVKQFNCFLCKTTYSELLKELLKELLNSITDIFCKSKRKTSIFRNFLYMSPSVETYQFILYHKGRGFLG